MKTSVHDGNHGSLVKKLRGPSLRVVLRTNVEAGHSDNGGQREDKSTHNCTSKVSFGTKIHTVWSAHESDRYGIVRIKDIAK